ncbi:MAG: redoxin family protein [Phycisphaerae bacterium]
MDRRYGLGLLGLILATAMWRSGTATVWADAAPSSSSAPAARPPLTTRLTYLPPASRPALRRPVRPPLTTRPYVHRLTTRPAPYRPVGGSYRRLPTTRPTTRPFVGRPPRPAGLMTPARPTSRPAPKPMVERPPRPGESIYAGTTSGHAVIFPDNYRGKLVMVTVWATWCPHCNHELAFWKSAYATYRPRGFEIIGIATDANRKRGLDIVVPFLEKNAITWDVIYDDAPTLSKRLGADSIPMSFLCDGDTGMILSEGGWLRGTMLNRTIEKYLARKFGPAATQPGFVAPPASQPASAPSGAAHAAR